MLAKGFIDREFELKLLEESWRGEKASLIVVYGRRRIGKTALLKKFLEGKRGVYLLAEEVEERELMREFSERIAEALNMPVLRVQPIDSWRKLLRILANLALKERLVVVIDEFQYATRVRQGLLSLIQSMWDEVLSKTRIMLILCGSIVSFVEDKVLSEKAPLYGRVTRTLRVDELSPLYIPAFTPNWNVEDHVRLYAVFGGVPGYLASVDPSKDIWWNIKSLLLRKGSPYYDEAKRILREEVRDVARYYSILEAVANGATRFSEILDRTGIPRESLYKYLQVLMEMKILEKQTPVVGKAKPVYKIRDHLLQFWFHYNARYRTALELELEDKVLEYVRGSLDQSLTPLAWEEIVLHIVLYQARLGQLNITPTRVGKWWHKSLEVDIVVIDDLNRKMLVGEVKWARLTRRQAEKIVYELEMKLDKIPYKPREKIVLVAAKEVDDEKTLNNQGVYTITLKTYKHLSQNTIHKNSKHIK